MAVNKAELINAFGVFKELMDAENEKLYVKQDGAKGLSTNDFTDELKEKLDGIVNETIGADDFTGMFSHG